MSEFIPGYNHKSIEAKWQKRWQERACFQAEDDSDKPKYYALVEFPYPSGVGMHIGHMRAYMSLEVISRKRRMEGYNVMFPLGFDAFGLPTENYALKHNIHPRTVTDENIASFLDHIKKTGFSFDLSRMVDTTDPEYYKFTQWIFLKMFEHDLVYRSKTYVNFCPDCKVVLSNEESQGGSCDRCGSDVVQKEKDVWFLKITAYAEKLLEGLKDFDSPQRIATEQEKWIGKSFGAEMRFPLKDQPDDLEVFTTRPDTVFGATFMVIAPEHQIIDRYKDIIRNMDAIEAYRQQAKLKTEFERVQLQKDKSGVRLEGLMAMNPFTQRPIPIFIADYVMITYGTGAIMAVPGHDQRDYDFAKKYDLPIIEVIQGGDLSQAAFTDIEQGVLINSDFLNGLSVKQAIQTMIQHLKSRKLGDEKIQYKMKDWAFNRQRYWGEPIPIIYCPTCGIQPVPYADLPVRLPMVEHFQPTESGDSPLANIESFIHCSCPKCKGPARRETDTMPQWAGSSWYFLRYMDPKNPEVLASMDLLKYWGPIDWYNGGMEHVTRHLIYSRFWNHFLYDIGVVPFREPYLKRTAQGLILGEDGEKMSKSRGNVVNPLEIISEYGADTLRAYILFIGDYEMATPWNENGLKGCRRFLDKLWRLIPKVVDRPNHPDAIDTMVHKTIKGVNDDYENLKFNTAIAKMMTLVNEMGQQDQVGRNDFEVLLKLLNPIAPHLSEEIWEMMAHETMLVEEPWPTFDPDKLIEDQVEIVININGKVRDKMMLEVDLDDDSVTERALEREKVKEWIQDKPIRKIIVVPNKLINIVI